MGRNTTLAPETTGLTATGVVVYSYVYLSLSVLLQALLRVRCET